MTIEFITIKGAREHNLKNISLSLPRNKLVVITGLSGSQDPGNTLTITVLEGAPSTNVLPVTASAHIDVRLLPFERCDVFVDRVRQAVGDTSVRVEPLLSFHSRGSTTDTDLYRAIENVAEATDPGAVIVPRMLVGFTDAHYFRDLGIHAYGFVPRWHRAGEARGIHGPDERVSVENLERGIQTLIAIITELDRLD